jgi:cupin fold WbuC family metalloprotein
MSNAFPNPQGSLFQVDESLLERGIQASRSSDRLRKIFPIHRRQDAPVQRMLNFLQPGTYIQPHMHPRSGAIESMYVMQGRIDFIVYSDDGSIQEVQAVGEGSDSHLIDIKERIWHSFLVRVPDTILFEVKIGPYDPQLDKTFASWAPAEGDTGVTGFVRELEQRLKKFRKENR